MMLMSEHPEMSIEIVKPELTAVTCQPRILPFRLWFQLSGRDCINYVDLKLVRDNYALGFDQG